jgi:Reverse transcriptase (RNA-dependent DNA polymerase)
MQKKSQLYKKFICNPSEGTKRIFVRYRNKLKTILRKAEKSYYNNQFELAANDQKKTWLLIRNLTKSRNDDPPTGQFLKNGVVITSPSEIAKHFNDFFVNVGKDLAAKLPSVNTPYTTFLQGNYVDSFNFLPTCSKEVLTITSNLGSKASFGYDLIPLTILKQSIVPISLVIASLINYSLSSGVFPNSLKIAKVCPVFKSGSTKDFSNYRPISLLPSFSKIFEKVVHMRLESYILKKNILISSQYGFRNKHSSYMALLDMYDKLTHSFDKGHRSIGIFIDLQKAFDSLNHSILLSKLSFYGIRGIAQDWFTSYLDHRSQYVTYNSACSDRQMITFGIPQGSILGPLLFILYINDIVNCSKLLHFILFADDTNLFLSDKNLSVLLSKANLELSKLSTWFIANGLTLNASKTNYILFGSKRHRHDDPQDISVKLNGNDLLKVDSVKFLGVHVDSELTWKMHTTYIAKKLAKNIGVINKVKYILTPKALKTLYYTLIYPHIVYCNIVWGNASILALYRITMMQKRAIRLINGANYRAHTSPLFATSNLLKLSDINKREILLFLFKLKNNMLPNCCISYIEINDKLSTRSYPTRTVPNYFTCPLNRTKTRDKFISFTGPHLWDAIPPEIRDITSISLFKSALTKVFICAY